jgi:ABC-type polysaccharide/polyol phosphate transport system ATPase subunit
MSSTSTSESPGTVLEVKNLNLVFRLRYYQHKSVRDLFVNAVRKPVDTLLQSRESLHVLRDLSLTVRKGDRVGVLGVNGSGKTSLCRCIADMLHPTSGSVVRRGSFQGVFNSQAGIIPELTGRENAALLARFLFAEESDEVIARMLEEALEFSELGDFLDTPFETYSQGMKSRLCLSVLTARTYDLLVLDEVYDSTDRFFQKKMTARLQDFIHRSGAVIFVSHSPELVRQICNRVIVLHQSRIGFDGGVEEGLKAYDVLNGASTT